MPAFRRPFFVPWRDTRKENPNLSSKTSKRHSQVSNNIAQTIHEDSPALKDITQASSNIPQPLTPQEKVINQYHGLSPCVLLLKGFPGVGKSTIAKALQAILPSPLQSRLLEYHTILDFCSTVNPDNGPTINQRIWENACMGMGFAPGRQTVIITTDTLFQGYDDDDFRCSGHGLIAKMRNVPFFAVTLHCDGKTNEERLCSEERLALSKNGSRKLVDKEELDDIRQFEKCLDMREVDFPEDMEVYIADFDVSKVSAGDSARAILEFLRNPEQRGRRLFRDWEGYY